MPQHTPEELEQLIADLRPEGSPYIAALASLIRAGIVVDSGDRKNGLVLWMLVDPVSWRSVVRELNRKAKGGDTARRYTP
jgi:hypothetical protein